MKSLMWILTVTASVSNISRAYLPADWRSYVDADTLKKFLGKDVSLQYNSSNFEGDISNIENEATAEEVQKNEKNVIKDAEVRWPNGTVPYTISGRFTTSERNLIIQSMSVITQHTYGCIRFRPHQSEKDHIRFVRQFGCQSAVGRQGGKQLISLARGCVSDIATIQHEILHALGLYHEISRTDRDQYIHINWDNIQKEDKRQFEIHTDVATFGLPYDYQSVMHYPVNAFAIDTSIPTIVPKIKRTRFGDYKTISALDAAKLQQAYKCLPDDVPVVDQTDESVQKDQATQTSFPTEFAPTKKEQNSSTRSSTSSRKAGVSFPKMTAQDCEHLGACWSFRELGCVGPAFVFMDTSCTIAEAMRIMTKAVTLIADVQFSLALDGNAVTAEDVAPFGNKVVALNIAHCLHGRITAWPSAAGLTNLLSFAVRECANLQISRSDFSMSWHLRYMKFLLVSFASIEKDCFDNLPQLQQFELVESRLSKSSYQLHCGCEYSWFRKWMKQNPSLFAAKTASQVYIMDIPFLFHPRLNQALPIVGDMFLPVDCAKSSIKFIRIADSSREFAVDDPCF